MAAAPEVDSTGNDADVKAHNAAVQSETMGTNNSGDNLLRSAVSVPVSGDRVETFGSSGNMAAGNVQFAKDEHGDSTEYSSSFGASCSVSDDDTKSDMNGMEVDSPFLGHINMDGTASVPKMVRQKQVTAEWRKTVRPLMWRCQWLELCMKDLSSQVAKYDKELALINHEKDLQLEMMKADSSNSELAKVDVQSHDRNTMKRRKRQRHEDIVDTSSYMKNHQILSYYYENKNSGAETDGLLVNDGINNVVVEDLKSRVPGNTLLESKDNDRVFEQYSLRELLLTIDGTQSRILRLQDHLSKVRSSKHEGLPSGVDHTRVKVPQKSHKARNQLVSCKKDGNRPQKKRDLHSLLQKEDMCRSLAAVTPALSDRSTDCVMGYVKRNIAQEGATQQDENEITFDMLFGAKNPLIHADVGELCKESADDVLIDNQVAQEEGYQQFEVVKQASEKHAELVNKVANTPLSNGEDTIATKVVKHEPVDETAPVVMQVGAGNKQGHKPKKKLGSSLPASKDQTKKAPSIPAKKKADKDQHNLNNEKPVFVAVNTRRSQRVRKPKIY